ncbi:MAG: alpha/beta hydrolase [Anaerolineae bacterium]|nr:alpha/beta hydrolase [Anaerolineae bacterium]
METLVTYNDGQTLAYVETGDPEGTPVLIQHGMIASILDIDLFEPLARAGARVIAVARPGYGRSSPRAIRTIGEWGAIVAGLVDDLGLVGPVGRFDVLGISSGAPYAYAIGHALPGRVRNLFILSGTPALDDPEIQARWPYPLTPEATLPELQALAKDLFFSHLTDADLSRNDVRDAMVHNAFGIALDLQIRCRDWGFPLADLRVPVIMQHSRADPQVPFVTAEMTARMLPNCRLTVVEGGDHFSPQLLHSFIERATR